MLSPGDKELALGGRSTTAGAAEGVSLRALDPHACAQ
jgi:hypothetical protein